MRNNETIIIKSQNKWYNLQLKELLKYIDLIFLFVKRNYSTRFKQTILGPAWLFISPMFTIITYTIVFKGIAGLSTDGVPPLAFYLSGNIIWTFFAGCFNSSAYVFVNNAGLFGKIYFPRLVTPLSNILTQLLDFLIQLLLLLVIMLIYFVNGYQFKINMWILYLPVLLLQLGLLSMGLGIIISSLTTKYKDLFVLVGFGLQIWMYASPVIYSITLIPEKFVKLFMLNPVTPSILIFRNSLMGTGNISNIYIIISWIITLISVFIGLVVFNKVEKTFMDTI